MVMSTLFLSMESTLLAVEKLVRTHLLSTVCLSTQVVFVIINLLIVPPNTAPMAPIISVMKYSTENPPMASFFTTWTIDTRDIEVTKFSLQYSSDNNLWNELAMISSNNSTGINATTYFIGSTMLSGSVYVSLPAGNNFIIFCIFSSSYTIQ